MPAKEGDRFSPEIWSLVGNPLSDNLIETYMRYVHSLRPEDRSVVLRAPNPRDGYVKIEVNELRANLTQRTPAGIYTAIRIYQDTLNEMNPEEKAQALEDPQKLIKATIRRLEIATPESNSPIYF